MGTVPRGMLGKWRSVVVRVVVTVQEECSVERCQRWAYADRVTANCGQSN
jgi:hypothetical protein